jgi:hypothetical protein
MVKMYNMEKITNEIRGLESLVANWVLKCMNAETKDDAISACSTFNKAQEWIINELDLRIKATEDNPAINSKDVITYLKLRKLMNIALADGVNTYINKLMEI